jgi:hypothetical protein
MARRRGRPDGPAIVADDKFMHTLIQCCKIQCNEIEAASVLGCSVDTLSRRLQEAGTEWKEFFLEHSAGGRASLRRSMFKAAVEDGNVTAQIWLSKQHLGMKDRTEHGFDPDKPAKFVLNMGKDLGNGDE